MVRWSVRVLVVFFAVVAGGCNGSSGPYGSSEAASPSPSRAVFDAQPPPPAPTLTIEVTNSTTAPIQVTASTPSTSFVIDLVAPGATVAFDLGSLPSSVYVTATALGPDASGRTPEYPTYFMQDLVDYSASSPYVAIEWAQVSDVPWDEPCVRRCDRRP
jgi:hypothetical protein